MNLSKHFTYDELTTTNHREFDNTPNEAELENLKRLANFLEEVKAVLYGKPIMVNSAFRSELVNNACGSKSTSQHRVGTACDIRVPGLTPDEVVKAIMDSDLPYDQLIREFDRWTHLSIPNQPTDLPRKQALIIDKTGTRKYSIG
jgi:hypothetical protein